MSDDRITALEERIAHLTHAVDELSATVRDQAGEIDRLSRRVALLLDREAERKAEAGGSATFADHPPPHR